MKTPSIPILPPRALNWSIAASTAAAISYADRGTSAIAASSLLEELHWNESQLGQVQSAFFVGYALTQVFGGVLGGRTSLSKDVTSAVDDGSTDNLYSNKYNANDEDEELKLLYIESNQLTASSTQKCVEGYRTVLPLSLVLTGITTFLFPMAAMSGVNWAILDRFTLGLLEGVLLPSAMAGVSSTTSTDIPPQLFDSDKTTTRSTIYATLELEPNTSTILGTNKDFIATASAIVIAGCYLGSAWAYLSAWVIFSEFSQVHFLSHWGFLSQDADSPSVWPLLFYVNGILSLIITAMFSSEFDLTGWRKSSYSNNNNISLNKYDDKKADLWKSTMRMMNDAIEVSKETLSSKSGRAIIAAQIGQGALLYSIASWGPLYLERVVNISTTAATTANADVSSSSSQLISWTAVAASIAASSLILPQITQAVIGMSVGFGADKLSSKIGSRLTRRSLQFTSGVVPALILLYLSILATVSDGGNEANLLQSPAFLFGAAQTISALSLGAVSVSHLEVATPSKSGAVYALGNVFAAISGSLTVSLFGILLDRQEAAGATSTVASASNFALPFQIVAILSAVGSIYYSVSIQSELEIGIQEKNSRKSR